MPLFWIVHEIEGHLSVFVQEAKSLSDARASAKSAGFKGTFKEAHELDRNTAARLPRDVIGQTITRSRARALLQRMRDH